MKPFSSIKDWLNFIFLIFILYWNILNDVVLVFGYTTKLFSYTQHVPILFQIIFLFRLLQNIEQSSQCYTVGTSWLSILSVVVCKSQTPNLSLIPPFSPGNHTLIL